MKYILIILCLYTASLSAQQPVNTSAFYQADLTLENHAIRIKELESENTSLKLTVQALTATLIKLSTRIEMIEKYLERRDRDVKFDKN